VFSRVKLEALGIKTNLDHPIPILIMTGYGEKLERDGQELPKIISEPVALKDLAAAITEVLA
jgi:hypothetical protein